MKKSCRKAPKKTLTKKQIKAALVANMFPNGVAPKQTMAERIVSNWTDWRLRDDWIKQNPTQSGEVATWDDQGNKKTVLEEHHEKFDDLNAEFSGSFLIALLREDAGFFRDIAAAISKRKRIASKLKDGQKPFDWKSFLLLKKELQGRKVNVHKLADEMLDSGLVGTIERESLIVDLFRRRKKLKLSKISKG